MRFDWTLTFGTVLQIGSMILLAVALFNALAARLTVFENTLKSHADALKKNEIQIFDLIADVQRLIGRSEVELGERRRHERGRGE